LHLLITVASNQEDPAKAKPLKERLSNPEIHDPKLHTTTKRLKGGGFHTFFRQLYY